MGRIGTLAQNGSIEVEADVCAVSGRSVLGHHSTMEQIGARHFVRYLSHKAESITDEMRSKWYEEAGETPLSPEMETPDEKPAVPRRQRKETETKEE